MSLRYASHGITPRTQRKYQEKISNLLSSGVSGPGRNCINPVSNFETPNTAESDELTSKCDISLPDISGIYKTPPKAAKPKSTIEAVKVYADQPMLFQRQKRKDFIRKRIQFTQQF